LVTSHQVYSSIIHVTVIRNEKFTMRGALFLLTCLLVLLARKFSSNGRDHSPPVIIYEGSRAFNLTDLRTPSSRQEIVDIVNEARQNGRKLRVVGSGHSILPLAISEGITLSLNKYRGVVRVDLGAKQITVKAGTTLREINTALDSYGLALSVLSCISVQSIAGAFMTGTHGTAVKHGNLATLVVSLEMITADGKVLRINRDDELFNAAVMSLGMLGVISEVTIQAEDAFTLREEVNVLTLQECMDQFHNMTMSHDYIKLWIDLVSNSCMVSSADKVRKDQSQPFPNLWWLNLKMHTFEITQWIIAVFPQLASHLMPSIIGTSLFFQPNSRVGKSFEIFSVPFYESPQTQQELSVDTKDCVKSLETLHQFVHANRIPVNSFIEIRLVNSDKIWLSPSYNRNSCFLTQIIYRPTTETFNQYFYDYFDLIFAYHPRPHWGKNFNLTKSNLLILYPKYEDFIATKHRLDPSGIFTNSFLETLFT